MTTILVKKFGAKLKLERVKRKLSQERLGELSGLSTNSIGAIERGVASPTLDTIDAIAKALGVELKYLVDVDTFDF